jgi:polysaccharide biosynthesis protein PelA
MQVLTFDTGGSEFAFQCGKFRIRKISCVGATSMRLQAGFVLAALAAFICYPVRSFSATQCSQSPPMTHFLVYYGSGQDRIIASADVVVLDSSRDVRPLRAAGTSAMLLGYLSLGEVTSVSPFFSKLQKAGAALTQNQNWPGSWMVDFRASAWQDLLITEIIPGILGRGFVGLFLDTVDDAQYLETLHPDTYKGMIEAAAELIRRIHNQFPAVPLMLNRGYAVLPKVATELTMVMGESIRTTYGSHPGEYRLTSEQDYLWQRNALLESCALNQRLQLFALDYWNPKDQPGIARLYAIERANGFVPYVATPSLDQIVPEPDGP